jgi:transposase InsO family protein
MPLKRTRPQEIAFWRYQQIEDALDPQLSREARATILSRASKTPLRWPSGATKPPSLAALYRWLAIYQSSGLAGLEPKVRRDRGTTRVAIPKEVVNEALSYLVRDPSASLTFLVAYLTATYPRANIPRSTLQRRLAAYPSYKRLKKQYRKGRTRFVAKAPHDIWRTDTKGPITIKTLSGPLTFSIISIIDDNSRDVLAALVIPGHENIVAAIRVFRKAALRYGLPRSLYADRGSSFDSKAFRMGLAILGACRIKAKPKNPQANGKIEAYHRTITLWFVGRLGAQKVIDLDHLQALLDAVLESMYRPHQHRGLKMSPKDALGGAVSSRQVPPSRLYEAFRQEKILRAHPITGEVVIDGTTYLVPDHLRGKRLAFSLDPARQLPPLVIDPISTKQLPLTRAAITSADLAGVNDTHPTRWAEGPLQAIHDHWHGKTRPLAEPGFGLPELYALLAEAAGRHVPATDTEADLVMRIYRDLGPLPKVATSKALSRIASDLGPRRPLLTYLEALVKRVPDRGAGRE